MDILKVSCWTGRLRNHSIKVFDQCRVWDTVKPYPFFTSQLLNFSTPIRQNVDTLFPISA
jgi:hypothetical protein